MQVLLRAARATCGAQEDDAKQPLPVEPARLAELAGQHGLTALLLRSPVFAHLSETDQASLKRQAHLLTQQSLGLTAALLHLTTCFEAAGLRFLAVKGPALAALAYPQPGLRPAADLDFLIAPEDFNAFSSVLGAEGFVPMVAPSPHELQLFLTYANDVAFVRGPLMVELHWALHKKRLPWPAQALATLWSEKQEIRLGPATLPTAGTADTLHYLCLHSTRHLWVSLKWLLDLCLVTQNATPSDFDALVRKAEESHTLRSVALGYRLRELLLGCPPPPPLQPHCTAQADALTPLTAQVLRLLGHGQFDYSERDKTQFLLAVMDRWQQRGHLLLHTALRPTRREWDRLRLPLWLSPLYWLLRPFRLTWDRIKKAP